MGNLGGETVLIANESTTGSKGTFTRKLPGLGTGCLPRPLRRASLTGRGTGQMIYHLWQIIMIP